ncbi:MAG TPA: nitroreductase family protein [Candidatus Methylomirabilis sp.]|nr:nitroreductase family protein [Candidatus Methylomirabilis sp.]HSC71154.1 nitroreductase family protein [Candidatus Methylomirabilis sp.]
MNRRPLSLVTGVLSLALILPATIPAQATKPIQLVAPQTDGGKPLMQALKQRRSARAFSPEKLPAQMLANLLWAAFGVNRPESGGRTAPTASNRQEIDVCVASADGLVLYEPKGHALHPILPEDIRALTGRQAFVKDAAVNLIYVADLANMGQLAAADRDLYSAAATGFISQNVYLYCASEGMATVVRASIDRPALAKAMGLRPDQKIILAQSVGYPRQ